MIIPANSFLFMDQIYIYLVFIVKVIQIEFKALKNI